MPTTFDRANRIIQLDGSTEMSVPGLYVDWEAWINSDPANAAVDPAFPSDAVISDEPEVPTRLTLSNGWRIRTLDTGAAYTLTVTSGFISTTTGADPFVTNGGVEPRIRYQDPVVAIGYSTGSGLSASQSASLLRVDAAVAGNVRVSADGRTVEILGDDGVTVLRALDIPVSGLERTIQ